jgi:integrase
LLLAKRKYEISQAKFNPYVCQDTKFLDFLPRYMEWAEDHKKPSTIERNHQFIKHLEPFVSDKLLQNITVPVAEEYKNARKNEGASNATVNREISFLKAVLNKAVKWGLIDKNPVQFVESLPESHQFKRYLTPTETLLLIDVSEEHLRPLIVTAIFTGLRWGNVRKLKWTEVDLENSVINLDDSKNDEHIYPLPDKVKQEITKLPKNGGPYLFINPETGKPWCDLRKAFKKAKEKAGITRPFRVHDLRHSFASNLLMIGNDLKTVQELLGHRNINTTLRYAHLNLSHKKKAVDGLFRKNANPDGHAFHHTGQKKGIRCNLTP